MRRHRVDWRQWAPLTMLTLAVLVGAGLWFAGLRGAAQLVWAAVTLVALLPAVWSTLRQLWRRQFGVDVVAVLALVGTLLVREYLAGAVIAVMVATGQALGDYAQRRATRDLRALLERAPRQARRRTPERWCRWTGWRWGTGSLDDRRIDTVRASDIKALMRQVTANARSRRNSRHSRHAGEHLTAAARAFYNRAIADGYLTAVDSPAHRVRKPRRLPNTRRALTPDELSDINAAARSGGNDIILDASLLRLYTETACRRGGALALRLIDLDADHALIRCRGASLRVVGSALRSACFRKILTCN